ncbi:MAG: YqaJ viral recombinase family protein [Clostridium sp.]|jgi:putative phage-type endonuclease|uniref:YqaJ viral recombinase family nuclease n=1 Tax=Clostridium sp. TaxID=1506 RepID=UPI0025C3858B|nr:YqaJ viral recombinase family protein [Clostridium sp.]MCH3965524.1 YqaJ viral recombinase family protein [Clostridium sp.]MCI1716853.1 YqaJ viral recombinase family protein [Clostridium sp.]MCI1801217.1 YqaJ viral recombinase family protein [Clostridium sp.]MCI1815039.1 YqaJ viral recombinase family protein [Clostridium sp.]MCI1871940.1 YqaJ viral recombinase family protein [Clostridium sp.]
MAELFISTKNISKKDWLNFRNKGIGGSDVAALCGINKYKSPVELWMEKTGQIKPAESGEAAYWGTKMEPIIREEFTDRTNLKIDIVNSILKHEKYNFMIANVDGITYDDNYGNCIFEAKTASAFKQNQWENSIPEEYMLQIQHYMAVTGFKAAYIAVLIGGNHFKFKFIKRDDELINMITKLENNFWNHVIDNVPLEIDGSKASTELLNRLYPNCHEKSKITLPNESLDLLNQYDIYKEKEKEICQIKNTVINKLKSLIGKNETAVIEDRLITWKTIFSEKLDSKKLKDAEPEIYKKYITKSTFRRFTVK